jgi:hypothetical protein
VRCVAGRAGLGTAPPVVPPTLATGLETRHRPVQEHGVRDLRSLSSLQNRSSIKRGGQRGVPENCSRRTCGTFHDGWSAGFMDPGPRPPARGPLALHRPCSITVGASSQLRARARALGAQLRAQLPLNQASTRSIGCLHHTSTRAGRRVTRTQDLSHALPHPSDQDLSAPLPQQPASQPASHYLHSTSTASTP